MLHQEAVKLIEGGVGRTAEAQVWIDLGAGSGTFTRALAQLVGSEGKVYAVDRNKQILKSIPTVKNGATIVTVAKDFTGNLALEKADGILIANALHFVRNKIPFVEKIKSWLKPGGRLIVVEYDIAKANQWIPYPVSFGMLEEISSRAGLSLTKIGEYPSQYHEFGMYAAKMC